MTVKFLFLPKIPIEIPPFPIRAISIGILSETEIFDSHPFPKKTKQIPHPFLLPNFFFIKFFFSTQKNFFSNFFLIFKKQKRSSFI